MVFDIKMPCFFWGGGGDDYLISAFLTSTFGQQLMKSYLHYSSALLRSLSEFTLCILTCNFKSFLKKCVLPTIAFNS